MKIESKIFKVESATAYISIIFFFGTLLITYIDRINPKVSAARFKLSPNDTSIGGDGPLLYNSFSTNYPKKVRVYGPLIVMKVTLTRSMNSVF